MEGRTKAKLFDWEVIEHSDFRERTARAFIIRVLLGEKRPDNFVTATIKPEHRSIMSMLIDPDVAVSHYDLELNCELEKAQLKITLTPKFITLKRFVLVVSCAPSLEICYVMEMLTQHSLSDWGIFDSEGIEVVRRWYKMGWTETCDDLVEKIWGKLKDVVQESVDAAVKTLSG